MSVLRAVVPTRILQRWDAIAAAQLCEAGSCQAEEMDRLDQVRAELRRAEESAEFWRKQALDMQLQLCERTGGEPGITQACELVVVPTESRPLQAE